MAGSKGGSGRFRIGIDIGGTFTDVVVFDRASGELMLVKVPSVPADPAQGFLNGFDRALRQYGIAIGDVEFIGHGTTVATNTIIEGKGATAGLIASEGFSDVLEIAYQIRPNLFDLMYDKPRPLVARRMALGVPERIGPDGKVYVPLDQAAVVERARALQAMGAEAVVIAFLHSYRFPAHERAARDAIQRACPGLPVVLSSDVCPEFREYPRTSTSVVNAVLLPRVGRYVARLGEALAERGARGGLHLMTSSGGVMAGPVAARYPVQLLESGPAATVLGANHVAAVAGFPNAIVFDMGGTTAKVAMVTNGAPRITDQFEVGPMAVASDTAGRGRGHPVRTPTVEMVEVGAGGGSVAAVDPGGALSVGPESMGADPGPACYAQGGAKATITDANLILGRLNPDFFLGGEKMLDAALAEAAVQNHIARRRGWNLTEAANAIIEVGVARMAAALKMVSIRRGIDPRGYVLVACGGGGPLHAAAIARQVGMTAVLIPPAPGLTSALGLLATDLRHDLVRNVMTETRNADPDALDAAYGELAAEGARLLAEEAVPPEAMRHQRLADLCYVGQAFQLRIPVPDGPVTAATLAVLQDRFHAAHKAAYGFASEGEPTEIVSLRLAAIGAIQRPELREAARGGDNPAAALKARRKVYFHEAGGALDCPIYDRARLAAGNIIAGPAVVEQMDTTTLLPPGATATVDRIGNLLLRV
ncbi:MAG: hydantoinase/oxoprolinase family protein [Alphaproteobacteria bacterium]|nr:hydantoinase/oxoprolinase family protein [Alphaproteobacteria bacterium]